MLAKLPAAELIEPVEDAEVSFREPGFVGEVFNDAAEDGLVGPFPRVPYIHFFLTDQILFHEYSLSRLTYQPQEAIMCLG